MVDLSASATTETAAKFMQYSQGTQQQAMSGNAASRNSFEIAEPRAELTGRIKINKCSSQLFLIVIFSSPPLMHLSLSTFNTIA
jgi:hypothetical protein